MSKKLGRKQFPSGYTPDDFKYQGRPAKDQDDFSDEVGIADMACVDQFGEFGEANKAKYYHMGVMKAKNIWFVYFEWGRIKSGKSWIGDSFCSQDYQFIECSSEAEARKEFQKKCHEKNTKKLVQKVIAGKTIWTGRSGKDGYIVQQLATRERGLPDAYLIKDSTGVIKKKKAKKKTKKKVTNKYQKQVVDLAISLAGGTIQYARDASAATGIVPTIDSIKEVREHLLDAAMQRISVVGDDIKKQVKDKDLIDISNHVAALVPRQIPRYGSKEERQQAVILSSANILSIQQDLDTFESSLKNEDLFEEIENDTGGVNPSEVFGGDLTWIDQGTTKGRWLKATFEGMSNDRHSYLSRDKLVIKNIFEVSRPRCDNHFIQSVKTVAGKNSKKQKFDRARLQPGQRADQGDIEDFYDKANVFLGIHGTRSVNVQAILSSNLRLPRQLKGVHISGANFGPGLYFATDWRKSYGYTGHAKSYYGNNNGSIKDRGFFMFLNDVIMGDSYMTKSTGNWMTPPSGKDSVTAYPENMRDGYLQNDEHIIYDANNQRIKYLIEGDFQ